MARDLEQHRDAMRAYAAFLRATVAYLRFLRARGRLQDQESAADVAALEAERDRVEHQLARPAGQLAPPVQLPRDPGARLAHAARRQLRIYREAVCAESDRLRATSGALVRRSRIFWAAKST